VRGSSGDDDDAGASIATSSGSIVYARAVEPTMSVKRAVITLRSSSGGGSAAASGEPQAPQTLKPSGFSWPQEGHVSTATA
jgi:hypothetical protein